MKPKYLVLFLLAGCCVVFILLYASPLLDAITTKRSIASTNKPIFINEKEISKLKLFAVTIKKICASNNYNGSICFMVDMSIHSGKKRFFVYDLQKDTVVAGGLVAHGSCHRGILFNASFSNQEGCGCSSSGKYVIGNKYKGRFGDAYKLKGLDTTNNNAYKRNVVLHAFGCVPDFETYPIPLCNSLGCAMVSYHFLEYLSQILNTSAQPVVLYIFK